MSKQETVKEFLLNDIREGNLKPGDRVYSRPVFMKRFKCARGTVDLALQSLIRANVLTSEKGRGTFVALRERAPATGHVAIVSRTQHALSLSNSILHGIMKTIGNSRKIAYFTYEDLKHPSSWEECKAQSVIIFLLPDVEHASFLAEARIKKVPHLAVYRDPPESPFVALDCVGGAANLVDALAKTGARKIAFAAWRQGRYQFAEQIYTGFLEGLLRNSLPLLKEFTGFCPVDQEEKLLKKIFGGADLPDALLFYGVAMGKITTWCGKTGLVPGRNFQLGNYNYVFPGDFSFPVMSPKPVEERIGEEAARAALELIDSPGAFPQIYITPLSA